MVKILDRLGDAPLLEAGEFFLLVNSAVFGSSILVCRALGWLFGKKRIFDRW